MRQPFVHERRELVRLDIRGTSVPSRRGRAKPELGRAEHASRRTWCAWHVAILHRRECASTIASDDISSTNVEKLT